MIIGQDGIVIVDINDGITTIEPLNPVVGQIWIDSSVIPLPMVKRWNGNQWINIGQLNPELSVELEKLDQKMSELTDDSLLDLKDRIALKVDLAKIIGFVIADSATTLPTAVSIEASQKGEFYTVRKSAIQAGLLMSNEAYIELAIQYNTLKAYLEQLTPIKPWDTSEANRNSSIVLNREEFYEKWLQYVMAVENLRMVTNLKLKENADSIIVGGKNLIRNSTFNKRYEEGMLSDWMGVHSIWKPLEAESDKPTSTILRATATGNSSSINYSLTSNTFPARIGDVFTFSVEFKVTSASAWDEKILFACEFYDHTGNRLISKEVSASELGLTTIEDNTWYRKGFTYKVDNANVVNGDIKLLLKRNGDVFFREVQVERGNRMLDWKTAPEDDVDQITLIEHRLADTEAIVKDDAFVQTVLESTAYQEMLAQKANQEDLGGLVNQNELDLLLEEERKAMEDKINSIDYSPFVKSSEFEQRATEINAKFRTGGGVNLIRNSTGLSNTDHWVVVGDIVSIRSEEVEREGFASAFSNPVGVKGNIRQWVFTEIGTYYTISFKMKKDIDASTLAEAGVFVIDENENVINWTGLNSNEGTTNGFKRYYYTFKATTSRTKIQVQVGQNASAVIGGIMLNIGFEPLQWSMANGEIYNTNVSFDINGIRVTQFNGATETGRTVMTPQKFAGYYDVDGNGRVDESNNSPDEVFRMDKDEFVMKKAVIKEEITMGKLKLVSITSPSVNGWAWVPNENN